jgi:hypothetical protein
MTNGPSPPLRSAINVFLTPASLNAAICSGETVTPAGGPLIISVCYYSSGIIKMEKINRDFDQIVNIYLCPDRDCFVHPLSIASCDLLVLG